MASPILRLYPDLWTQITSFCNTATVLKLLSIGCPQLTSTVARGTTVFSIRDAGGILDLDALLRLCSGMINLTNLTINPCEYGSAIKVPTEPLKLPPTLTRLHLHFDEVFSQLSQVNLASSVPHLLELSVKGRSGAIMANLGDIQVPATLESLTLLIPNGQISASEKDILALPRTLTTLNLSWLPSEMTTYAWPPLLSSCLLHGASSGQALIENLPRTVTHLCVTEASLSTAYKSVDPAVNGFQRFFPWRLFFPRLRSVSIPPPALKSWNEPLQQIRALIFSELDAANAKEFILRGYWNLPLLPVDLAKSSFPTYDTINIGAHCEWIVEAHMQRELEMLAPALKNIQLGQLYLENTNSVSMSRHFGLNTNLKLSGNAYETLPRNVTSIDAAHIKFDVLHPNLTSITCRQEFVGYIFLDRPFFRNLKSLTCGGILPANVGRAAVNLTYLNTRMDCWSASYLSGMHNLQELSLDFNRNSMITHLRATLPHLAKLTIRFREDIYQHWTLVEDFCRSFSVPSSLTSLHASSARASLFQWLPSSLKHLNIEKLRPYRYNRKDIRRFEFENLPRGLLSFHYSTPHTDHIAPSHTLLQQLPPRLVSLRASIDYDTEEDLKALEAFHLVECHIKSPQHKTSFLPRSPSCGFLNTVIPCVIKSSYPAVAKTTEVHVSKKNRPMN